MTTTLGEVVRDLREARRMSQSQLAERAGTSQSYVSMIESRKRGWYPSRIIVQQLAKALSVKEKELLDAAELGYIETDPAYTVQEAIEADPYLTARERKAMIDLYRAMVWGRR